MRLLPIEIKSNMSKHANSTIREENVGIFRKYHCLKD